MDSPASDLTNITKLNFDNWNATFWLVKRHLKNHEAFYSVLRVNIESKLEDRFRSFVEQQLQRRSLSTEPYDFVNTDADDTLLTIPSEMTDFPQIEALVQAGNDNAVAKAYDELLNSWAYVIQLEREVENLFAWRKINTLTKPKNVTSRKELLFRNMKLLDIEEKEVFTIDPNFDFFAFKKTIYISEKKSFEISMNFREGIKEHGRIVLEEFRRMDIFSKVDLIAEYTGDNLNHLRKLAAIEKAGYYKQPTYLEHLIETNRSEGWGLKVEGGQIQVELETMDLLLKLLNNDRLRSPINGQLFDASAKTRVS